MKKQLNFFIGFSIFLTACIIFFYFLNFGNNGISSKNQDWGDFASFLSGATAPILAILNLVVLVKLTLSISDFDNQRMLTELRFETYKEFINKINSISDEVYSSESITKMEHFLRNYSLNNFFLLEGKPLKVYRNIHLEFYILVYKIKLHLEEEKEYNTSAFYNITSGNQNDEKKMKALNQKREDYFRLYEGLKINYASFLQSIVSSRPINEYYKKYDVEKFDPAQYLKTSQG